jgi:branched-chain amino acid transport system substrate-binding protein
MLCLVLVCLFAWKINQQVRTNKTQNTKNHKPEIQLGFISPLTGTAAVYGEPALKSAQLAVEQLNSQADLPFSIKLIVEDGKCDGQTAASAAQKLISVDKVRIILGGHCSTETLAIAPIAEKAKVVVLASITSSPKVTEAGDYIFRNYPSSQFYTPPSADIAIQKGYKTVSTFYENKEFPKGQAESFRQRYELLGGKVVSEESFSSDSQDLRTQLLKIKQQNPQAIFFASQASNGAVAFFSQLSELGLLDQFPVIGGAQVITGDVNTKTNGKLNGRSYTTDAYVDAKKTQPFISAYTAKYGQIPPLNLFWQTSSYDGVILISQLIQSCGNTDDAECIKNKLYQVKDWNGASGQLTIDQNGDAITPIGMRYFDSTGKEIWEPLTNSPK